MSTRTKTLAKSLHTVTALVQVARLISNGSKRHPSDCISAAAIALGYANCRDPYGLRDKARAILAAE